MYGLGFNSVKQNTDYKLISLLRLNFQKGGVVPFFCSVLKCKSAK